MAVAAEKFRREMDAMRDELNAPAVAVDLVRKTVFSQFVFCYYCVPSWLVLNCVIYCN